MNPINYLKIVGTITIVSLAILVTYLLYAASKTEKDKLVGSMVSDFRSANKDYPRVEEEETREASQETRKRVRFADEIQSSDGYGFKNPPPLQPVFENNLSYSSLPVITTQRGEKFGSAKGKTCVGVRTDFYMDSVLPECQTYCDNGCTAFVYNETNGDCSIFTKCTDLENAAENMIAFVRIK